MSIQMSALQPVSRLSCSVPRKRLELPADCLLSEFGVGDNEDIVVVCHKLCYVGDSNGV